jgi:hypothetical protein
VIEDIDNFNSQRSKRLLILLGLLGGGTAASFVLNILHYFYKLVIKNVDDLNSLQRNTDMILRTGLIRFVGLIPYLMRVFSLEIYDMMVIKDAGFNSLRQKIDLMILRFLEIVPMASYLIFCLLEIYSRVIKNVVMVSIACILRCFLSYLYSEHLGALPLTHTRCILLQNHVISRKRTYIIYY